MHISIYNINVYYIGYITKKISEYVGIHGVNPLYFIIDKVDGLLKKKIEINT